MTNRKGLPPKMTQANQKKLEEHKTVAYRQKTSNIIALAWKDANAHK